VHFSCEYNRQLDADERNANEEDDEGDYVRLKDPSRARENVAHHKVRKAPQDINKRRGQPLARRVRKRAGERIAGNPVYEVGYSVGEKQAGKEAGDVMIPFHFHENSRKKILDDGLQLIGDSNKDINNQKIGNRNGKIKKTCAFPSPCSEYKIISWAPPPHKNQASRFQRRYVCFNINRFHETNASKILIVAKCSIGHLMKEFLPPALKELYSPILDGQ
jgi:hypothetical protein